MKKSNKILINLFIIMISVIFLSEFNSNNSLKNIIKTTNKTVLSLNNNCYKLKSTEIIKEDIISKDTSLTNKDLFNQNNEENFAENMSVVIKNKTKSTNNNIKSIQVEGFNLEKVNETNYTLTVRTDITKINIKAEAEDPNSSITGLGEKELKIGDNNIQITITSESGEAKIVNIKINRKDAFYKDDLEYLLTNKTDDINIKNETDFSKEEIEKIKNSGKIVNLNYYKNKQLLYSWIIDGSKINNPNDFYTEVIFNSNSKEEISKLSSDADGKIISFKDNTIIPEGTKLKIYVADKFEDNELVNIYYYSKDDNKLKTYKKKIKVQNGYIEFEIKDNYDYFITKEDITNLKSPVKQKNNKSNIPILPFIIGPICLFLVLIVAIILIKKKKSKKEKNIEMNDSFNNSLFKNDIDIFTENNIPVDTSITQNNTNSNPINNIPNNISIIPENNTPVNTIQNNVDIPVNNAPKTIEPVNNIKVVQENSNSINNIPNNISIIPENNTPVNTIQNNVDIPVNNAPKTIEPVNNIKVVQENSNSINNIPNNISIIPENNTPVNNIQNNVIVNPNIIPVNNTNNISQTIAPTINKKEAQDSSAPIDNKKIYYESKTTPNVIPEKKASTVDISFVPWNTTPTRNINIAIENINKVNDIKTTNENKKAANDINQENSIQENIANTIPESAAANNKKDMPKKSIQTDNSSIISEISRPLNNEKTELEKSINTVTKIVTPLKVFPENNTSEKSLNETLKNNIQIDNPLTTPKDIKTINVAPENNIESTNTNEEEIEVLKIEVQANNDISDNFNHLNQSNESQSIKSVNDTPNQMIQTISNSNEIETLFKNDNKTNVIPKEADNFSN